MNYSVQKDISIGSRMKHQGYVVLLKKCVSFYLNNLFRLHEVTTFTPCEDNLNMIDNYVKSKHMSMIWKWVMTMWTWRWWRKHIGDDDVNTGDNDVNTGEDNVNTGEDW